MSEDTDSVYYCTAALIAKRGLIVLNKRPCRVTEVSEVDGKVQIHATDIMVEDKEVDATFSPDDEVGVPVVERQNYQVCRSFLNVYCLLIRILDWLKGSKYLMFSELLKIASFFYSYQ